GEPDLFVGDVRGPNAHARGHIPHSLPLVLGSPPPATDADALRELAKEVGLRLRRHGLTGEERLVLVDRGDGMGSMPAAQMAELAGHPRVAVLTGGLAGWPDELATGQVELLDVRSEEEYLGLGGMPCGPRQGHIPGARRFGLEELFAAIG